MTGGPRRNGGYGGAYFFLERNGKPFCLVPAYFFSSFEVMDFAAFLTAGLASFISPRLVARAIPMNRCCFLDVAGIAQYTEGLRFCKHKLQVFNLKGQYNGISSSVRWNRTMDEQSSSGVTSMENNSSI